MLKSAAKWTALLAPAWAQIPNVPRLVHGVIAEAA